MGYITHISDEICKLIDTCGSALNKSLGKTLKSEGWIEYASKILPETKFQDCQPLGGERPNNTSMLFRPNPFEVSGDVDNIGNVLSDVDGLDMSDTSISESFSSKESLGNESIASKESSILSTEKIPIIPSTSTGISQISISSTEYLSTSHNSLNKSWSNINNVNGSNSSLNFSSANNLHSISNHNNISPNSSTSAVALNGNENKNENKSGNGNGNGNGSNKSSLVKINKKYEKDNNSDDEDDDIEGFGNVSVMNNIKSDQFARYICQQVVHDLPGKFLVEDNSDSDTDEELDWLRTIEDNTENDDNLNKLSVNIFPQLKDTFETNELREALNSLDSNNL